MKRLFTTLIIVTSALYSKAQNTFPATGNAGIGTSSPATTLDIQKVGAGASAPSVNVAGYSSNSGAGAFIILNKSRGTAVGSLTTTNDGDNIGLVDFKGVNASATPAYAFVARINASQDGAAGTTFVPGKLSFFTSDAANGPLQRMTISSSGNVGIGTVSPLYNLQISGGTNNILAFNTADAGTTNQGEVRFLGNKTTNPTTRYAAVRGLTFANSSQVGIAFDVSSADVVAEAMRINSAGNVGIGTMNPDQKLTVNGTVHARSVVVDTSVPTPDYVFEKDYRLPTLAEVRAYTDKNHHLPDIPTAAEFEKGGINVGEMNMALLKKVEELTLYLMELNKRVAEQQKEIEKLKRK
ncbi:hypothetical protein [Mucilaginibacter xinganensis]|uniref:Peptidase S74 domain-containing protein n=1 Tax=Mucilaginibacter xinganensis TaxID=1234841 RepID=A0A223P2P3_9SPHI|nr:hypothetical protein [Mucilaginibacter xinganensis]ASU36336.1 hypothetical protein MuYL_4451 [Mucilaginibacter xinganensis]